MHKLNYKLAIAYTSTFVLFLLLTTSACATINEPLPTLVAPITLESQKGQEDEMSSNSAPIIVQETKPTVTPMPIHTFSLSQKNQGVPEAILDEITFYSGGGEGDPLGYCDNNSRQVRMGETELHNSFFLHNLIFIHTCGWQNNETVGITIRYPDGRIIQQEQTYINESENVVPMTTIFTTSVLEDPPGQYQFIFSGESGAVEYSFVMQKPEGPHLYGNVYGNGNHTLMLYNFEPNETVGVFAYTLTDIVREGFPILKLYAWQTFQVDQNGNLLIETQLNENIWHIAVVGDISGEVSNDNWRSTIVKTDPDFTPICNIAVDDTITLGTSLSSKPEATNYLNNSMAGIWEGPSAIVIDGPQWGKLNSGINYSGWWWKVTNQDTGESGWIWQEEIIECAS